MPMLIIVVCRVFHYRRHREHLQFHWTQEAFQIVTAPDQDGPEHACRHSPMFQQAFLFLICARNWVVR